MASELELPAPLRRCIAYWRALHAPASHVATRLGIVPEMAAAALAETPPLAGLIGHPSAVPWAHRTLAQLVWDGLNRAPDRALFVVAGQGALSVGEVRGLVAQVAGLLRAAGAGNGVAVAVDATQRLESALVVMAAALIGAPVVRLAGAATPDAVRAQVLAAPAAISISADAGVLAGLPQAGQVVALGEDDSPDFAAWLGSAPATELPQPGASPADTALIGFTSGSTGLPKLVRTAHEAVYRASEAMQALFGFGADEIFATATDFSALSAFRSLFTLPLLSGGQALLPSALARRAPLQLAAECAAHGVTTLTAVPAVLRGLVAARDRLGPLPALRRALSGSGILDQATHDRFVAAFAVPAIDYYGGREFATALYAEPDGSGTVSSQGGVPTNVLIALVDDAGQDVADGGIGQIMVHSDCLMQDLPSAPWPQWQGWHASGDLGRRDAGGRVAVVGRLRDVVKARDGSLLFPIAIEALIVRMPEVAEAAVFGHVGRDGSEQLVAVVLPVDSTIAQDDPDLANRVRAHLLAQGGPWQVPAGVFVVHSLPRAASAKVDKPALVRQIGNRLELL